MQNEILEDGVLLDRSGKLTQVGWARQQNLDSDISPRLKP